MAGIDSLVSMAESKGKMAFSVLVGVAGPLQFRKDVRVVPAQSVQVALQGATEFSLCVQDVEGLGNRDYANWADAKVTLEDGREFWLGDLPVRTAGVSRRCSPSVSPCGPSLSPMTANLPTPCSQLDPHRTDASSRRKSHPI